MTSQTKVWKVIGKTRFISKGQLSFSFQRDINPSWVLCLFHPSITPTCSLFAFVTISTAPSGRLTRNVIVGRYELLTSTHMVVFLGEDRLIILYTHHASKVLLDLHFCLIFCLPTSFNLFLIPCLFVLGCFCSLFLSPFVFVLLYVTVLLYIIYFGCLCVPVCVLTCSAITLLHNKKKITSWVRQFSPLLFMLWTKKLFFVHTGQHFTHQTTLERWQRNVDTPYLGTLIYNTLYLDIVYSIEKTLKYPWTYVTTLRATFILNSLNIKYIKSALSSEYYNSMSY